MDKIRPFIFISILGGLIYLGFIYNWDQGVIDDEYVASESYRQLEEKLQDDQRSTASADQKVRRILMHVISNDSKEVEFPLNDIVTTFIDNNTDWNTLFDFRFKDLGRFKHDLFEIYFVLLQKPGVYDESGLLMATSLNDSLLHLQTIGQFKDTVTETVKTQVHVKTSGIIFAEVLRKRLYPVEQKNVNTYSYEILESGKIKQVGN